MRITRDHGTVRVRLDAGESDTLAALITDLSEALAPGGLPADDPVAKRLFPAGYDDPEDAAGFRELTEAALRDERIERTAQCLAELAAATPGRRHSDMRLDPDAVERWIKLLNDLRLAVGTRIGVTEDDQVGTGDLRRAAGWAIYDYLTGVQDTMVRTLLD
jgi:Domain of unknown function (DUF2017)